MKTELTNKRWSMLSWILVPLLIVWLATNYLIGQLQHPDWKPLTLSNTESQLNNTVLAPDYHWHGETLLTLWFDDAWQTQFSTGYGLLEEYNLTAALAVPTQLIGYPDYMSWAQVKKLESEGWEITSHTRTHDCSLDISSLSHQSDEIIGGLRDLREASFSPDHFVSPCGVVSDSMLEMVKENFSSYRTSTPGLNPLPVSDKYNLLVRTIEVTTTVEEVTAWIREAQRNRSWLILVFHQIDEGQAEFSTTPGRYRQFIQAVLDSQVKVVLPSQALGLIDER